MNRQIVYCYDEDEVSQWSTHVDNLMYKQHCAIDPEIIKLVKEKERLERSLWLSRNAINSQRAERQQELEECLDAIRIIAYSKWPLGNWQGYRQLTVGNVAEGSTVLIQTSIYGEEVTIIKPNSVTIQL